MEKRISRKTNMTVTLDGTTCLRVERVITSVWIDTQTGKMREEVQPKNSVYALKPVTVAELSKIRESGKPGFVLKQGDNIYYAAIPKTLNLSTVKLFQKAHCCAREKTACKYLSAAKDCDGGCAKVRDREQSKRIEKYRFITQGWETFNVKLEVFRVTECARHEDEEERESKPVDPRIIESLKAFMVPSHSFVRASRRVNRLC